MLVKKGWGKIVKKRVENQEIINNNASKKCKKYTFFLSYYIKNSNFAFHSMQTENNIKYLIFNNQTHGTSKS